MKTGSISFTARVQGLMLTNMVVEADHPNVICFVCNISDEGTLNIRAVNRPGFRGGCLEDIYSEDWPIKGVAQEVQKLTAMLSLEFNCSVHRLRGCGLSLLKRDGSGSNIVVDHVGIWDSAQPILRLNNQSIERFKNRFREFGNSPYPRIYSSALRQEDPTARFMFLYNIILMLSGDRQVEVDRNILLIEPNTPKSISPNRSDGEETSYTRLRNEIAHYRTGSNLDSTSMEIANCVSQLGEITKQLILANREKDFENQ